MKPLVKKAYGSIPHLPHSRLGPGDHYITFGQSDILTVKPRDKHDRIIVQEKLDGSCVAVANIDGAIVPLVRAGYLASSSPHELHHAFDRWVKKTAAAFERLLAPGERIAGEWLAYAHGTLYDLTGRSPFVAFDILKGSERIPFDEFRNRVDPLGITRAPVIHEGDPIPIDTALAALGDTGLYGATETAEGVVYRVERRGKFDFAAKFVRHGKVDGKYFPETYAEGPVWLWKE